MKKISSIILLIILTLTIALTSCTENEVTPSTTDPGRTGGGHGDL